MDLELKTLDKISLLKQTHETVRREKLYTTCLLQHLLEVEKRNLHLEQGYSNFHSFLVLEFKYSDSEAATRMQAMKLLKAYPEVKEKMEKGAISLSQAADINRFVKAETLSRTGICVPAELHNVPKDASDAALSKMEESKISFERIVKEVEGKSMRETKKLLDNMRSSPKSKIYTIEIDEEAWNILQEIKKRELSSARDGDFTKRIFRERLNGKPSKVKNKDSEKQVLMNTESKDEDKSTFIPLTVNKDIINKNKSTRYIGKKIRSQLFQEANFQCEYVSTSSGRRCECKSNLQVDHLYPYAWGGGNDIVNTRILCVQHNLYFAEKMFGKEKMGQFRRT